MQKGEAWQRYEKSAHAMRHYEKRAHAMRHYEKSAQTKTPSRLLCDGV